MLLIATLGFGLVVSGCDSGGTSPDSNNLGDVSGAITGQVIDNATSNPIEGAKVVVAVGSLDTDGKSFSATTGSEGRFAITDLPATTADDGSNTGEDPSAKYGIRVETPDGSAYRDAYRGQVELAYGNNETGAVELGANITFPLQKNNGSLSGQLKAEDSGGNVTGPLRNTELRASQTISAGFNPEEDATSGTLTVTATTTTDGQGSFTFENLVVGDSTTLYARFNDGSETEIVSEQPIPDEGSAASVEASVSPPALTATLDPAPETDFGTTEPEWTLTFNRPVAGVTTDDVEDALSINESNITTKAVDGSGNVELDVSATTTEGGAIESVSWSVAQPLSDGIDFEVGYGGLFGQIVGAQYGVNVTEVNPSSASSSPLSYSIGANTNAPATPSVSFQPSALDDDGELTAGSFNYNDVTVTALLQVDEVDNSDAEVKGYEVFYSSQYIREDRSEPGTQFQQLGGITSVSNAEFGNGRLTLSRSTPSPSRDFRAFPFAAEDGSYGDVQFTVRAVSINNERSAFSDTLTIADNDSLTVNKGNTEYTSDDTDGNPVELTVEFDEPVDESTVAADQFSLDNAGSGGLTIESVAEVNNTKISTPTGPGNATGEVVLEISGSSSTTSDDVLTVNAEGVTDLAGNPVDVEGGANEDDSL
ncbi:carboxypeptidase-like regulatory domain-containing protein [Salinibacter ruber]|uniref:carboxypeptidase-like regulatory domain-containing protein n=1 Tax=Salinibacter ruber TaxID=146919 RepID=UPI002167DA40|nr:carboxypeptidase-like regulatory domain-containing protein [Salinibacter ruber]MCS3639844.1 hypothetical protein [Salinibacter ruber]